MEQSIPVSAGASLRTERQLAAITADSADAILLLDNDGLIQSWNASAERLFGYPAAEVIGRHFRFLIPPDLLAQGEIERLDREMLQRGSIHNQITHRLTRDGRRLTMELSRTYLRELDGSVVGSSSILRDVTEREREQAQVRDLNRRLETQVRERTRELSDANERLRLRQRELEKANAELVQLDKLKSEFVSLVSHELRAPLTIISGALQLLLGDEQDTLSPNQREILSMADEQTNHLTRLVRGVLDIARIEAGQMPLARQAFDLSALIDHALEQWRHCDSTHTWLAPQSHNLPSAWGDPDRVEQVLMNLFDNAFKYSREGGTIRVDVQVIQDQLVTAVSDEGEGIPASELEKIFDKFHRVEQGDARETYGHGLGLYISRKFIEAMGGALWAESEVGKGSVFCFSLPLAGQMDSAVTERGPFVLTDLGQTTNELLPLPVDTILAG